MIRPPAPEPPAVPVQLLDWRDGAHFCNWGDEPCVLCRTPTPLRSHQGEPVHKTCAELWIAQHPGEVRFVSGAPRRRRDDGHA
jgi:hypothetical protein